MQATFQNNPVLSAIRAATDAFKPDSTGGNRDRVRIWKSIERGGKPVQDALGVFLTPQAVAGCNQKGLLHMVRAVSFAVTTAAEDFTKSTAHAIALVMLSADDDISFESVRYLMGTSGMLDPKSVNGVSRARFQRFIGRAGTRKTIESRVSSATGKRGFLTALGVSAKSSQHGFTLQPGARESGFVLAYAHALQSMTDGQFQLVMGDDE